MTPDPESRLREAAKQLEIVAANDNVLSKHQTQAANGLGLVVEALARSVETTREADAVTDGGYREEEILREAEVEVEHHVTADGVDTHTDLYVPSWAEAMPVEVAERLWREFDIAVQHPPYSLDLIGSTDGTDLQTDPDVDPVPDGGINWRHLNGFERDVLEAVAALESDTDETSGQEVRDWLQERYRKDITHGRLYPNLDSLIDRGLLKKGQIDRRTNSYDLTDAGRSLLKQRAREAGRHVDDAPLATDGGVDLDELSDEEIEAVLNTPAFQKSVKYRRLAQGIEVLEDDDAIYRQLVATILEKHSSIKSKESVEQVLDLFVAEVKTYTEGMELSADGEETELDDVFLDGGDDR